MCIDVVQRPVNKQGVNRLILPIYGNVVMQLRRVLFYLFSFGYFSSRREIREVVFITLFANNNNNLF